MDSTARKDSIEVLRRLHDWAQAMSPEVKFTGDHPIAVARALLTATAEKPAETNGVSFEEAWRGKELYGFRYGEDAIQHVRLGWEMHAALNNTKAPT